MPDRGIIRIALACLAPALLIARTEFDPVADVAVKVAGGVLTLSVPPGVHLKVRGFRVTLASRGVLRLGPLPPGSGVDEAGDPIWRGGVKVRLRGEGLEDPVRLVVTYQPCTEGADGRCFLPVRRVLAVPLSAL